MREKNDREMKGDATNVQLTMTLSSGETGESNPLKISQTNETNDEKHCPSLNLYFEGHLLDGFCA